MPVMEIDRPVPGPSAGRRHQVGRQGRVPAKRAVVRDVSPAPRWSSRSSTWQPLAGSQLLERLRVTGRSRPMVDPELADRLRDRLERGLRIDSRATGGIAGTRAATGPSNRLTGPSAHLVVTKDRLTRVLTCESHCRGAECGDRIPTSAMACGALVDVLFRQLVTVGGFGDAMADGLAALAIDDRQRDLLAWIERMAPSERAALSAEVERQAHGLRLRWPTLNPAWLPRTQEALRASMAHGAVELSGRVDLAIGRPAVDEASVALVEVKSGVRRPGHRADLHFYALVEALRSAAPPFVVATYYTRTGELDVDPVTEELLVAAAQRTLIGTRSLWSLANGSGPLPTPSGLCGSCAVSPECEPGQARVEGRSTVASNKAVDR